MSPQTLKLKHKYRLWLQRGVDSVLTWYKGRVQSPPLHQGFEHDLGQECPFMVFSVKMVVLFSPC